MAVQTHLISCPEERLGRFLFSRNLEALIQNEK
jgi:hypothetical protein